MAFLELEDKGKQYFPLRGNQLTTARNHDKLLEIVFGGNHDIAVSDEGTISDAK